MRLSVTGAGDFGDQSLDFFAVGIKEGETFFGHFHRAGIAQNREHLIFELHEFRTAHTARGRDLVKEDVVTIKLKRTRGAVAAQIAGQTIAGEELQNRRRC